MKNHTVGEAATSYDEIGEILQKKAENQIDKEKVLVTVSSVQSFFKIEKNKNLTKKTIRNYGICIDGYWETKHPGVFEYQKQGDPNYWGLVMKPEKYLQEVRDYTDEEIEKLKPEKEEVEA